MTKEFELPSGKYVVVKVPDDAENFRISNVGKWLGFSHNNDGELYEESLIDLPPLNWKLIAPIKDITEEQAATIVECDTAFKIWKNYDMTQLFANQITFYKAKESFTSLMQSLEIYSVNPYGEKAPELEPVCCERYVSSHFYENAPVCCGVPIPSDESRQLYDLWQTAQENTANWVLLKKI